MADAYLLLGTKIRFLYILRWLATLERPIHYHEAVITIIGQCTDKTHDVMCGSDCRSPITSLLIRQILIDSFSLGGNAYSVYRIVKISSHLIPPLHEYPMF